MKHSKKLWFTTSIVAVLLTTVLFLNTANKGRATSAPAITAVAVEVTPVAVSSLSAHVSAVGTVAAAKDVEVSSETAGRVVHVLANVGDVVRAGQPLVVVDDELKIIAVDQARAQLIAAETHYRKTEKDFRRAENLHATGDLSDAELDAYRLGYRSAEAQFTSAEADLRYVQRQLDDTRIKAPVAGIVASRSIEVGEMVNPGKVIANIVDLSSMKVKLSIPEEEIAKVRVNQPAKVRVDMAGGEELPGKVMSVSAKTESPTGHTYAVEVVVTPAKGSVVKAGMFARVEITVASIEEAVVLPREVLTSEDGNSATLYVAEGDIARRRSVILGVRTGEQVQIVSGLSPGELVVSFGQKKLKDGATIQYQMYYPN